MHISKASYIYFSVLLFIINTHNAMADCKIKEGFTDELRESYAYYCGEDNTRLGFLSERSFVTTPTYKISSLKIPIINEPGKSYTVEEITFVFEEDHKCKNIKCFEELN